MKCIIAGCRTCTDYSIFLAAFRHCPFADEITHVISGGARGADALGER